MGERPGLKSDEFGTECPRTLDDLLDLYSSVLKRQVIKALVAGQMNVTPLAKRIRRVVPHVSNAVHELSRAGLLLITHDGTCRTCSLTERVAVHHEGRYTFIEFTALNGEQLRVRVGRLASAQPVLGHNGVAAAT